MGGQKKILLLAVLLGAIALTFTFRTHLRIHLLLEQIAARGPWGPLVFILLYLIGPSLLIPGKRSVGRGAG